MLPGLWQVLYSLGIFASCRLLPRSMFGVAVFYLLERSDRLSLSPGRGVAVALGHGRFPSARVSFWPPPCSIGPWSATMTPNKTQARRCDRPLRLRRPGAHLPREGPAGHHDLAGHPPARVVFADLKELCHLTDGNLSRHLQVLHEAGFVEIWKGFHSNRPQTLCRITDEGRRRFLEYINVLETVVRDALDAARADPADAHHAPNLTERWSPA